jgi:hypothetical protein
MALRLLGLSTVEGERRAAERAGARAGFQRSNPIEGGLGAAEVAGEACHLGAGKPQGGVVGTRIGRLAKGLAGGWERVVGMGGPAHSA